MAMSAVAAPVAAQEKYPERSIPVIIPFAAGSASDVVGRIVLDRMADDLGHRFVIDNQAARAAIWGRARRRAPRRTAIPSWFPHPDRWPSTRLSSPTWATIP
jgi:hypothetical protein